MRGDDQDDTSLKKCLASRRCEFQADEINGPGRRVEEGE
jgi:hypothetical protein